MRPDKMKLRGEKGSLTIEASLIMGLMIIFITSWILILHLFKIQAYTQHALDQAVLNLSDEISMVHSLRDGINKIGNYLRDTVDLRPSGPLNDREKESLEEMTLTGSTYLAFQEELKGGRKRLSPAIDQWIEEPILETSIDDEHDLIQVNLTYEMKLPGPLKLFGPKIVHQNAGTGIWVFTDDPILGVWNNSEEDRKKKEESIWKESNFSRGRKFAEKYRKQSDKPLPPGHGIDFIDKEGKGVAVFSFNIFSDHYSQGEGRDPAAYQVKDEAFIQKIRSYIRKTKKDIQKFNASREDIGEVKAGAIILVLPEEAEVLSDDLHALTRKLEKEEGLSIVFVFDQKAFPGGEKDD